VKHSVEDHLIYLVLKNLDLQVLNFSWTWDDVEAISLHWYMKKMHILFIFVLLCDDFDGEL